MYMDRLNGLLGETDFERIYAKVKADRSELEERIKAVEQPKSETKGEKERAEELVRRFLSSTETNRELLVSLIERVELTEDKKVIIKFRFHAFEAVS